MDTARESLKGALERYYQNGVQTSGSMAGEAIVRLVAAKLEQCTKNVKRNRQNMV